MKYELWGFDGDADQKWTLVHTGEGYYKIVSGKSGKVVTAPDSLDANLQQQSYEGSDNQLWKIIKTGNGKYRLAPKSSPSNYMAAAWGVSDIDLLQDGRNVQLRAARSDGKDVWQFITSKDLTLVALPENYDRTSFFNDVISSVSKIGYHNYYENQDILDQGVTEGELLARMANSKIMVIRTHGQKSYIVTSDGSITRSEILDLPNDIFAYNELTIYGACLTGSGRAGANNLVNATHERGSHIVIGFEKSVWNTEVNEWCKAFFKSLSTGKTIMESCEYADEHIVKNWYTGEDEITTDSWYIAGSGSFTLPLS